MHTTVTLRKTRFLLAIAVALIPFAVSVAFLINQAQSQQAVVPEFGGGWVWCAVGSLLLSIFVVWWKGVASLPLLVITPILALAAYQSASASAVRARMQSANEIKVERISVGSKVPGYTVRCNGVELGKTPLSMTIEEFDSKVTPATQPPPQPSAIVNLTGKAVSDSNADEWDRLGFQHARWSAFPYNPHVIGGDRRLMTSRSNSQLMSVLEDQKYWWTFAINEYQSRKSTRVFTVSNGTHEMSAEDDWGVLREHISLLRLLAEHDSVDLQTAFADHIAEYSPPLQQALEADQQERDAPSGEPFVPTISLRENYSDTPLEFDEAVSRQDWIWVARSNDPRSAPLLIQWVEKGRKKYGAPTSFLIFGKEYALVLMESELPEISLYLADIMAEANWTNRDLLQFYVARQLRMNCDRNELSAWVAKIDDDGSQVRELLVKISAPNFATYAEQYTMQDWAHWFATQSFGQLGEPVIRWLTDQWQQAPDKMLLQIFVKLERNIDVQEALKLTDLSTSEKTRSLIDATRYTNLTDSFRNLLSEAAAREIKLATIPKHVTALADLLVVCNNETALATLESCSGSQKPHVAKPLKTLKSQLKYQKEREEERLQLARDLVAGKIRPDDLVPGRAFVWEDGRYKPASE